MRTAVAGVLVLLLALTAGGCAHTSRRAPDAAADDSTALTSPTTITVENRNFSDVVLYAVHDGTRTRLGTVVAGATRSFALQAHMVQRAGSLQFAAHAIGERRIFVSERVTVMPGQTVDWLLESGLERSSLSVR